MNFRKQREEGEADINLTPLIDVVFLLLIFFMVSTTFQKESELKIRLPEASRTPSEEIEERVEIQINERGEYFVNGRALVNSSQPFLLKALSSAAGGSRDLPVVIKADKMTPHQAVVTAMDTAAQLGLVRLQIATSQAPPAGAAQSGE